MAWDQNVVNQFLKKAMMLDERNLDVPEGIYEFYKRHRLSHMDEEGL
jgi:hypothetical protein